MSTKAVCDILLQSPHQEAGLVPSLLPSKNPNPGYLLGGLCDKPGGSSPCCSAWH